MTLPYILRQAVALDVDTDARRFSGYVAREGKGARSRNLSGPSLSIADASSSFCFLPLSSDSLFSSLLPASVLSFSPHAGTPKSKWSFQQRQRRSVREEGEARVCSISLTTILRSSPLNPASLLFLVKNSFSNRSPRLRPLHLLGHPRRRRLPLRARPDASARLPTARALRRRRRAAAAAAAEFFFNERCRGGRRGRRLFLRERPRSPREARVAYSGTPGERKRCSQREE